MKKNFPNAWLSGRVSGKAFAEKSTHSCCCAARDDIRKVVNSIKKPPCAKLPSGHDWALCQWWSFFFGNWFMKRFRKCGWNGRITKINIFSSKSSGSVQMMSIEVRQRFWCLANTQRTSLVQSPDVVYFLMSVTESAIVAHFSVNFNDFCRIFKTLADLLASKFCVFDDLNLNFVETCFIFVEQ